MLLEDVTVIRNMSEGLFVLCLYDKIDPPEFIKNEENSFNIPTIGARKVRFLIIEENNRILPIMSNPGQDDFTFENGVLWKKYYYAYSITRDEQVTENCTIRIVEKDKPAISVNLSEVNKEYDKRSSEGIKNFHFEVLMEEYDYVFLSDDRNRPDLVKVRGKQ